ncbi:MAG: glycosyltransferase [Gammaproteobacteria bacterium]
MKRVGVSVLNYRAAEDTIACVRSLLRAEDKAGQRFELSVRVVDNGSGRDEGEHLREMLAGDPRVTLSLHESNVGFAAGHNRNIEAFLRQDAPDYVWLLNNDCLVDDETVPALLACCDARPGVAVWGATLLETDGRTVQCAGGCAYRPWLSSFRQHGRGRSVDQVAALPEPTLDYVAGASLFMPVATLTGSLAPPKTRDAPPASWLNEEFFLYFEELDLARRLEPDLELGWCRGARIRHAGGGGTGARPGRRSPTGEYHSTLSALKYTDLYEPGLLWLMAPARFGVKAVMNLFTGRLDLLRALASAYGDFFAWRRGDPQPLRYR